MQKDHRIRSRSLMPPVHRCWPVLAVSLLAGCAGLSEIQDAVSHLDQGAHAASSAQATFLNTVQTTECDSQFFTSAYKFSIGQAPDFQLAGYCQQPTAVTPDQIKLRNSMMDALVLYADKMLALATSADNKQLDQNAQGMAAHLRDAAQNGSIKLQNSTPAIAAGVTVAFVAIAEWALDQRKYKGIVEAANAMQAPLDSIVLALTTENYAFARAIIADHQVLESELRAEVALTRCSAGRAEPVQRNRAALIDSPKSAAYAGDCGANALAGNTFLTILRAREVLASATGSTNQELAAAGDWSGNDLSKPLNDALPALARANQAIAKGASGGVYAAAHDLYTRSVAAKDQYGAMNASR